jgi:hypothetical protein
MVSHPGVLLQSSLAAKSSMTAERLCCPSEHGGNEDCSSFHVVSIYPFHLPLSDHRHRLKARQCSPGGPEPSKSESWSGQPFDASMILLDDIVGSVANFLTSL